MICYLIGIFGLSIPEKLAKAPLEYTDSGQWVWTGTLVDCPALIITALVTVVLVIGIKESARFNTAMVITKVAIVLMVIAVGLFYLDNSNWKPFAPFGLTGISFFGETVFGQSGPAGQPLGMLAGAAIIFFSYIGFDSVSTHAEEARNPSGTSRLRS